MKTATFSDFRQHAKTYFDYVEKGETIKILRHGRVIAKLIPSTEEEHLPSWKKPHAPVSVKGVALSKLITKERRESGK